MSGNAQHATGDFLNAVGRELNTPVLVWEEIVVLKSYIFSQRNDSNDMGVGEEFIIACDVD